MAKKARNRQSMRAAPKKGKLSAKEQQELEQRIAKAAPRKVTSDRPPRQRKAKKGGARAQALPGMEQVRSAALDRICEDLADDRKRQAQAVADEKSDKQLALAQMHQENIAAYHHAGIELVRVPGEEKLRVRVTDEDGANATLPADAQTQGTGDPQVDGDDPAAIDRLSTH